MEILCTTPLDPKFRGLPPAGSRDYVTRLRELLTTSRRVAILCPFIDAGGAELLDAYARQAPSGAIWEICTRAPNQALRAAATRNQWLLYEYEGTEGIDPRRGFHCKVFVGDGSRAIVGSVNLVYSNLVENVEVGVFVDDGAAVATLRRVFMRVKGACRHTAT